MRDIANSKMEYPYLRVELERSAVEVARSVLTGGGKARKGLPIGTDIN